MNSPPEPPEGADTAKIFISDVWPPELWDSKVLFLASHFVVICYYSPRTLTQKLGRTPSLYTWLCTCMDTCSNHGRGAAGCQPGVSIVYLRLGRVETKAADGGETWGQGRGIWRQDMHNTETEKGARGPCCRVQTRSTEPCPCHSGWKGGGQFSGAKEKGVNSVMCFLLLIYRYAE